MVGQDFCMICVCMHYILINTDCVNIMLRPLYMYLQLGDYRVCLKKKEITASILPLAIKSCKTNQHTVIPHYTTKSTD